MNPRNGSGNVRSSSPSGSSLSKKNPPPETDAPWFAKKKKRVLLAHRRPIFEFSFPVTREQQNLGGRRSSNACPSATGRGGGKVFPNSVKACAGYSPQFPGKPARKRPSACCPRLPAPLSTRGHPLPSPGHACCLPQGPARLQNLTRASIKSSIKMRATWPATQTK